MQDTRHSYQCQKKKAEPRFADQKCRKSRRSHSWSERKTRLNHVKKRASGP